MRHLPYILLSLVLPLCSCVKQERVSPEKELPEPVENAVPEGYFVASFGAPATKGPVNGPDNRVQALHYLVFKDDGTFVKEREIFTEAAGTPVGWPLTYTINDTLPKGSYRAVFIANSLDDSVLSGYQAGYSSARINLPNYPMDDNSQLFLDKITFSDTAPAQTVLLERIISRMEFHRNLIDAQQALDSLVGNIVSELKSKNVVENQLEALGVTALISGLLDHGITNNVVYGAVGGLDGAVSLVLGSIVDMLYDMLLEQLVHALGTTLEANADQGGLLGVLGQILNPWTMAESAAVTFVDFPRSIDFDLSVQEIFPGSHQFVFPLTNPGLLDPDRKQVPVHGFAGAFDMSAIDAYAQGLVSGVVVDGVLDSDLLLTGALLDVTDPLKCVTAANCRYLSEYSFLDLGLQSYDPNQKQEALSLDLGLLDVANLGDVIGGIPLLGPLLKPIVSGLLDSVLNGLVDLVVGELGSALLPINVPLLGIDNLELSGSWSELEQIP